MIEQKYLKWCENINEHHKMRGFRQPPTPHFQSGGLIIGDFAYDLISDLIDVKGRQQYICDMLGGIWFNRYGRAHQSGWVSKTDALAYLQEVYDIGVSMAQREKK